MMGRRDARARVFDGIAFFDGCDRQLLAEMAHQADRVRVPAGTVLTVAGQHAWQLLVVVEGIAQATDGGGTATVVSGQTIAPRAVAEIAPWPATVTTLSEVEVLVLNGLAFGWAVRQHPHLARPDRSRPAAVTTPGDGAASLDAAGRGHTPPRLRRWSLAARFAAGRPRTVHARHSNVIAGVGR
jgi:hypothetical protein